MDADCDDFARVYRFDLAHQSDLMWAGARGVLAVWFWQRRGRVVNFESRRDELVFCCCCSGHLGNALRVVQAKRHVHSATGSGLSAGLGSSHALAVESRSGGALWTRRSSTASA